MNRQEKITTLFILSEQEKDAAARKYCPPQAEIVKPSADVIQKDTGGGNIYTEQQMQDILQQMQQMQQQMLAMQQTILAQQQMFLQVQQPPAPMPPPSTDFTDETLFEYADNADGTLTIKKYTGQ